MEGQSSNDAIPEGWVLETIKENGGNEEKYYLCPATGQQFFTYEDLMRYVKYAKANKLSIYAPDFEEKKKGFEKKNKLKGKVAEGEAKLK